VTPAAQPLQNIDDWVADLDSSGASDPRAVDLADTTPPKAGAAAERLAATAKILLLERGLYALDIGETAGTLGQLSGLPVPIVQVAAPTGGNPDSNRSVEIIDNCASGEKWLGPEGGTVILRSPPGGGHVLVTSYSLAAQAASVPKIDLRRLDRPRSNGARLGLAIRADEPEEIRTEIVLHIERQGDRRFPGQGWIGNRGKKLRIEAFSIRPVDTLMARDIEFKALGPNRRETPWVTDAKLCGTRGQGLPLTGFAVRLAPHIGERFDAVYHGAFFESGTVGPSRNGDLCVAPIADDPLEAINLRLIRRAA
jgi:hypothetical protein